MSRKITCGYCGKDISNTEQFDVDGEYACIECWENNEK